ncbi:winged helix-turn-helix domain-containing protein [Photobacterium sp. R1]
MATESLTRCYRFNRVDFEPDLRLLVWPDKSETALTLHESRLLETLCYFAGEVISHKVLSDKTFLPQDSLSQVQQIDLASVFNSVRRKLTVNGMMAIPIEVLPHYGFRVPLPKETCRHIHRFHQPTALPPKPPRHPPQNAVKTSRPKVSATEHIVRHSLMHKLSVILLAAAGVAMVIVSNM